MKKLVGVLAMMFTAMLALAGCVNTDAHVTIEGQDKASGTVEVTTDRALLQGASLDDVLATKIDTRQLDQMAGENWTYEKIETQDRVGLRFNTVSSMNFVQLQDAFQGFELPVQLGATEDGFKFAMRGNAPGSTDPNAAKATMSVTFPGSVTSTTGPATIEGHTVTFDMVQGATEYEATGKANYALFYSVVFGGALLVLTLIIVLAMAPKAKDTAAH